MKLLMENLPPSLQSEREVLSRCLDAFNRITPVRSIYLFGSNARHEARLDSDVDLCIVADGAERQQDTARRYREAIWEIWPRPSLTLIPIAPATWSAASKGDFVGQAMLLDQRLSDSGTGMKI